MEKLVTETDYVIEDFEEVKLNFKRKCVDNQLIIKTGLTQTYNKNRLISSGGIRNMRWYDVLKRFGSNVDTTNCFIDKAGNYCLLYDGYELKIDDEKKILKILTDALGIDVQIEFYKLEKDMRDPPFLDRTFHRDIGICIRIPPKHLII